MTIKSNSDSDRRVQATLNKRYPDNLGVYLSNVKKKYSWILEFVLNGGQKEVKIHTT